MGKTIVWIDDDTDVIGSFVRPLELAGFKIIEYHTAREVLQHIEDLRQADLILLDILLPAGDGELDFEDTDQFYTGRALIREVRRKHGVTAPVIALTIVRSPSVVEDLNKEGITVLDKTQTLPSELKKQVVQRIGNAT